MKPRVLVVDDDPLYAEAATAILGTDGRIEVVGRAANGQEAVERALALQPDVVLMDINMPVLDGIAATRRLRRALPSARVVLVSASTVDWDWKRIREAGAFASVAKALPGEALVEAALAAAAEAVAS
jgi:DNA-binding NarL/FixJ family response regulator